MNHLELTIVCNPEFAEIVMAELSMIGFDTIEETDDGFNAYILEGDWDKDKWQQVEEQYTEHITSWSQRIVEKENWNANWEQNYDPIVVDDKCIVKAKFHDIQETYPFEITINPKMSFGTGHHETTYQILSILMDIDCEDQIVMDAGCGTGVLAIMAKMRGAKKVEAFDVDDWCIDNSQENFDLNDCSNCNVRLGTIRELTFSDTFQTIIANINKNVLLDEMVEYSRHLYSGGTLILSGFYSEDIDDIKKEASIHGLEYQSHTSKNNWAAVVLQKNG